MVDRLWTSPGSRTRFPVPEWDLEHLRGDIFGGESLGMSVLLPLNLSCVDQKDSPPSWVYSGVAIKNFRHQGRCYKKSNLTAQNVLVIQLEDEHEVTAVYWQVAQTFPLRMESFQFLLLLPPIVVTCARWTSKLTARGNCKAQLNRHQPL